MICDNCKGKGYVTNPRLFNVPSWKAYEQGYDKPIRCKVCGGSGFIIGNAAEVISAINIAIDNKKPLTIRELKQIKIVLEK